MTYPKTVPSGNNVIPYTNASSNLGDNTHHFGTLHVDRVSGTNLTVTATGSIYLQGASISTDGALTPASSGTDNLGSSSNYYGTIYVNKVVQTGSSFEGTMQGPGETINSGVAIWNGTNGISLTNSSYSINNGAFLPANSGTQNIGSLNNPVGTLYANFISGNTQVAKAWALWNQETGTPTISGSFNVSSLTDVSVGITTVNFITPMPDSRFSTVGTVSNAGGNIAVMMPQLPMTTGVKVTTSNTGAFLDYKFNSLAIFSNP